MLHCHFMRAVAKSAVFFRRHIIYGVYGIAKGFVVLYANFVARHAVFYYVYCSADFKTNHRGGAHYGLVYH